MDFTGLGSLHYEHILNALTKREELLGDGPLNDEVSTVKQFCMRVMALLELVKFRTGNLIANDIVAMLKDQDKKSMVYNSAAGRIHGSQNYPACVNGPIDWAKLFGQKENDDDEDEDNGPWLTPRMAARLHYVALYQADMMIQYFEEDNESPRLPRIARPFFKKSKEWRESFHECYVRIAMRLQKGLPPKPNCTGEELAFHNIVAIARSEGDEHIEHIFEGLPTLPNDNNYGIVKDCAVLDEDVLMLFEEGDYGYSDSDDETLNAVPGKMKMTSFLLGAGGIHVRAVNMHPGEWFVAFKDKHFSNHLP